MRLGKSLNSLYRLDEMYYALRDLAAQGISVSPLAINAIILGAGRRGNLDRAFATFQESSTLFKVVKIDIFPYHQSGEILMRLHFAPTFITQLHYALYSMLYYTRFAGPTDNLHV